MKRMMICSVAAVGLALAACAGEYCAKWFSVEANSLDDGDISIGQIASDVGEWTAIPGAENGTANIGHPRPARTPDAGQQDFS